MDKSKQQHKPLTAAFHRSTKAPNQPPLTPKLASPSPGYQSRRLATHDHPYSTPSKEDPVSTSTFLSANITPRSGSRTLRRRDDISTSPVPSPQAHYSHSTYPHPAVGLGLHATGGVNGGRRTDRSPGRGEQPNILRTKPLITEIQPASSQIHSDHDAVNPTASPMFFHASDVRPSKPIYAPDARSSKSEIEPYRLKQGRLSPASHSSQFVYANGDQEQQSPHDEPHPIVAARRLSGTSGTMPRGSSTPILRPAASPSLRLRSPQISATSAPFERSQISPPLDHTHDTILHRFSSPPNNASNVSDQSAVKPHRKASSVDFSSQPHISSPLTASHNPRIDSTVVVSDQVPRLRPRVFSNSSSLNGSSVSTDACPSMPLSPGKPEGPGSDTALNNSRTERRILDLEISNSSLLAINRTLEREMRKQNAEIRRYRRLSRSGRISMIPSQRTFSGPALSVTSEGVSECSSVHEASEFSDEDSVLDEGVHSPDSLAEHDAKHQAHDEKKFMLDLARHQELLVDSQKLNQSLKRCLGWTEELIKEGQKALEYSVHVQDVVLGGRVLAPEELPETSEARKGLLSPSSQYSDYSDYTSHQTNSDDNDTDAYTLPLPSSPGGTA